VDGSVWILALQNLLCLLGSCYHRFSFSFSLPVDLTVTTSRCNQHNLYLDSQPIHIQGIIMWRYCRWTLELSTTWSWILPLTCHQCRIADLSVYASSSCCIDGINAIIATIVDIINLKPSLYTLSNRCVLCWKQAENCQVSFVCCVIHLIFSSRWSFTNLSSLQLADATVLNIGWTRWHEKEE
jgi:hypothetical protein